MPEPTPQPPQIAATPDSVFLMQALWFPKHSQCTLGTLPGSGGLEGVDRKGSSEGPSIEKRGVNNAKCLPPPYFSLLLPSSWPPADQPRGPASPLAAETAARRATWGQVHYVHPASHSINIGRGELGSKCQGLGSYKGKYVPVERHQDCPAYWAGSSVTPGEGS